VPVGPTDQGAAGSESAGAVATQPLDLEVRRLGLTFAKLRTQADPGDGESLHRLLLGAIRRRGCQPSDIDEFELIVREPGDQSVLATYVATAP
jgi:hypothetical protein